MDNPDDCLHCKINRLIDAHNERIHLETGDPVSVEDTIDDLLACVAELIAYCDDAKTRRWLAKREAQKLMARVRLFREEGRYPVGPGQSGPFTGAIH